MPKRERRLYPYGDKIRQITSRASIYFEQEPALGFARPTKRELAKIKHLEWVDEQLLAFSMEANGFVWGWQLPAAQQPQYPHCRGRVDIKRLQDIYADWEGIVYFPAVQQDDPDRLATFKVVDFFADEACVGIYHDERRDPELYFYAFSEGAPRPLGVDFNGYLELMKLSLAYRYWAVLLADLAQHVAAKPGQPFGGGGSLARRVVHDLMALVPEFSLDAFAACYDQVRLNH